MLRDQPPSVNEVAGHLGLPAPACTSMPRQARDGGTDPVTAPCPQAAVAEGKVPVGLAAAGSPDARPAPLDRRSVVVGAGLFVVLMALSGRYGFHRDEMYYLDAGRHLQPGYVAQPVLAPLLSRLSLDLFGLWLPGVRLWAALAAWATVVVAALLARELGGGRRPQLLSAIAVATAPGLLSIDHQAGPTPQDVLAWAVLAWMVVRVGRTLDQRWWVPAGLALGLGLANKHMVGFFAIAIAIGLGLAGGARTAPQPLVPPRDVGRPFAYRPRPLVAGRA